MNLGAFELQEGMKSINVHKNLLKQQINVKSLQASHINFLHHVYTQFTYKFQVFTKLANQTSNLSYNNKKSQRSY